MPGNLLGDKEGFFFSETTNPPGLLELSKKYNIANAINYIRQEKNYVEEFGFASTPDLSGKGVLEFYLNNVNFIKQYIAYFFKQIEPFLEDKELIIQLPVDLFESKHQLMFPFEYDVTTLDFHAKEAHQVKGILSEREYECFKLIIQGKTREEVARTMSISLSSVGTFLHRAMDKLKCSSRSELIAFALENNILIVAE